MALRAFRTTFLIAIDEADAVANWQREEDAKPVTLDELKEYLNDALIVDVNTDEYGDPLGFQSAEIYIEKLKELTSAEVKKLYKK
jgi:hypothetical protein